MIDAHKVKVIAQRLAVTATMLDQSKLGNVTNKHCANELTAFMQKNGFVNPLHVLYPTSAPEIHVMVSAKREDIKALAESNPEYRVVRSSPGFRSLSNGKVVLDVIYFPSKSGEHDTGTWIFAH